MSESAITAQAYPTQHPWVDISGYLVGGVRPRFTDPGPSCAALVQGNTIFYLCRLTIESAYESPTAGGGWLLIQGLPSSLRVASPAWASADYTGALTQVAADQFGRIVVPARTGQDPADVTQISFAITGWRAS